MKPNSNQQRLISTMFLVATLLAATPAMAGENVDANDNRITAEQLRNLAHYGLVETGLDVDNCQIKHVDADGTYMFVCDETHTTATLVTRAEMTDNDAAVHLTRVNWTGATALFLWTDDEVDDHAHFAIDTNGRVVGVNNSDGERVANCEVDHAQVPDGFNWTDVAVVRTVNRVTCTRIDEVDVQNMGYSGMGASSATQEDDIPVYDRVAVANRQHAFPDGPMVPIKLLQNDDGNSGLNAQCKVTEPMRMEYVPNVGVRGLR